MAVLKRGIRVLRAAGVNRVGEAEPAHGDLDANISGHWHGRDAFATVSPKGTPLVEGEVTETFDVVGISVQRVRVKTARYVFLRFDHGRDSWAVFVLGVDGQRTDDDASLRLVRRIVQTNGRSTPRPSEVDSCQGLLDSGWTIPGSEPQISYDPETGIAVIIWDHERPLTLDAVKDRACKCVPILGRLVRQLLRDANDIE